VPGTKEIRSKIASVKSTQKITKAMQMVATSKMRRAQERMRLARPYAQKMLNVIGHLTEANPDYRHPFLVTRQPNAVGIIVVSTDRGLAGALNANVFKQTLLLMREWQAKGASACASSAPRDSPSSGACRCRFSPTSRASATGRT
jgi:F-type H+-transporting ATPase subunit gamma